MLKFLVTRTQLARLAPFTHRSITSLTTTIHPSLTVTRPQCPTKDVTAALCRAQPSAMYSQDLKMESLSDSPAPKAPVDSDLRPPVLPEELSKNVLVLSCQSTADGGVCDVHLVGTIHFSEESSRQVQAIVNFLKPEVVFLELCSSRKAVLTRQNRQVPTAGEVIATLKEKHNMFRVLYGLFLTKIANKLAVFPGSEFCVAYEEAIKYGGRVVLGDRPVQITLRRMWSKMPLWHKTKLLFSLLLLAVFLPSSDDLNKMLKELNGCSCLTPGFQEMSKVFPTLMETLVHERDQYMSSTLLKVASESSSVVAVVGKGHLQGIKKHWKQPVVMEDLLTVPSPKPAISAMRNFTSVGVAAAGVAIISGIYFSCKK